MSSLSDPPSEKKIPSSFAETSETADSGRRTTLGENGGELPVQHNDENDDDLNQANELLKPLIEFFPNSQPRSIVGGVTGLVRGCATGLVFGASSVAFLPFVYLYNSGISFRQTGVAILLSTVTGVSLATYGFFSGIRQLVRGFRNTITLPSEISDGKVWDLTQERWVDPDLVKMWYVLPASDDDILIAARQTYQNIFEGIESSGGTQEGGSDSAKIGASVVHSELYDLLGVPRNATSEEIRHAYYQLALKYHPDKNPGNSDATVHFNSLNTAFRVLSNELKRKEYDRTGLFEGSTATHKSSTANANSDSGVPSDSNSMNPNDSSTKDNQDPQVPYEDLNVDCTGIEVSLGLTYLQPLCGRLTNAFVNNNRILFSKETTKEFRRRQILRITSNLARGLDSDSPLVYFADVIKDGAQIISGPDIFFHIGQSYLLVANEWKGKFPIFREVKRMFNSSWVDTKHTANWTWCLSKYFVNWVKKKELVSDSLRYLVLNCAYEAGVNSEMAATYVLSDTSVSAEARVKRLKNLIILGKELLEISKHRTLAQQNYEMN